MKAPGVSVRPIRTMGGDHELNEVFFDNVRVPQSERIGEENQGWDCAKYLLEFERGAGIFSPRLRLQLNRVGDALEEMKMRGAASSLSARFGEVLADLDTFEMLELKTIGALQPGEAPGPVSSVLKLRSSRLRQAIAEFGLEVWAPKVYAGMETMSKTPAGPQWTFCSKIFSTAGHSRFWRVFRGPTGHHREIVGWHLNNVFTPETHIKERRLRLC